MVRDINDRRSNVDERVRQRRCQPQEQHVIQQPVFPLRNLVLEEDELVWPEREDQRSADELREEVARGSTSCCGGDDERHPFEHSEESTSEQRHEHGPGNHERLHKYVHQTVPNKNLDCVIARVYLQIISAKQIKHIKIKHIIYNQMQVFRFKIDSINIVNLSNKPIINPDFLTKACI